MTASETAATAGVSATPGRPAQAAVIAALFVDFGDKERAPRARYECVPCNYRSHVVTGAAAVAAFVETAADTHRSVCPSRQENHQ